MASSNWRSSSAAQPAFSIAVELCWCRRSTIPFAGDRRHGRLPVGVRKRAKEVDRTVRDSVADGSSRDRLGRWRSRPREGDAINSISAPASIRRSTAALPCRPPILAASGLIHPGDQPQVFRQDFGKIISVIGIVPVSPARSWRSLNARIAEAGGDAAADPLLFGLAIMVLEDAGYDLRSGRRHPARLCADERPRVDNSAHSSRTATTGVAHAPALGHSYSVKIYAL